MASSSIHEERPVLKTAIVREWLYAVSGLMAGFVFTALTKPHDYATGWFTLLAPYVVTSSPSLLKTVFLSPLPSAAEKRTFSLANDMSGWPVIRPKCRSRIR